MKVETQENINYRKVIDGLNQKNFVLKEKLSSFGVSKVPVSDIEKKLFFSENDKILKESSLISDVHDEIR